jgi:hypothetical protein
MVLSHLHGSNREKLHYATPYHVYLNGTRSNSHPGPTPFHRRSFRAMKSSSSWHRVRVWLRRVIYSIACHHHDGDCANTRIERKAGNREHLRTFSFYFRTRKYCNPTPPFAYYKRGGRDPWHEETKNGETMPSNGNILCTHSNIWTHPLTET